MGKIRTKVLGSEQENVQKKKDEARRETKKLTKLQGKGGGRITDLTSEKVIDEEALIQKGIVKDETKKAPKPPKHRSQKYKEKKALVEKDKLYPILAAIKMVKETSYSKFIGSVEVHINLKEKGLRGTVIFPHGTGKQVRVAIVDDKLLENLAGGKIDFDILVSHPQYMAKLAKYARILGPKGLMPNPKAGTISTDPSKVAQNLSKGQTQWKTEAEAPIVHLMIGKVDFEEKKLAENLDKLIKAVNPDKINSLFLKATMGPSVKVQVS